MPLGHEVEVVWYEVIKDGWSGVSREEQTHTPRVTDLSTGIEYLNSKLVDEDPSGRWRMSEPLSVADEVRAPFEVSRVLIGKVRRCRLITIGNAEIGIQTHLHIEPNSEQPAYR